MENHENKIEAYNNFADLCSGNSADKLGITPDFGNLVQIIFSLTSDFVNDRSKKRRKVDGDDILTIKLTKDKIQKKPLGTLHHNEIATMPYGKNATTDKGVKFYVLPPTIAEATLSAPRGAAIIYPKDAAFIITFGDIAPGMSVLECGLGSGALTCSLLRAVAGGDEDGGSVTSIEQREDFFKTGVRNVKDFFNDKLPATFTPINTSLEYFLAIKNTTDRPKFDRVVLDLLNPWDYLESAHSVLKTSGIVIIYITTITQMTELEQKFATLKDKFINIECVECIRRPWKMDNLSIRPEHSGILHSGFIITARAIH